LEDKKESRLHFFLSLMYKKAGATLFRHAAILARFLIRIKAVTIESDFLKISRNRIAKTNALFLQQNSIR
jgi:hypothetical protein